MSGTTQLERLLSFTSPLGPEALIPVRLEGEEAISAPFRFRLELLAPAGKAVPFERILGAPVTAGVLLPGGQRRCFNGIVSRLRQGGGDGRFVTCHAEIVPKFWLLTRTRRCRVFQRLSVPEILQQVLAGIDITPNLTASYPARDYCVQYSESDFDFASRLMEEEGIHYFFSHAEASHRMTLADSSARNPWIAGGPKLSFDPSRNDHVEERIHAWEKTQELRAGQYTMRDYCFELPEETLEATQRTRDRVTVGATQHSLKLAATESLELYDYPGRYAGRLDGIGRDGAPQPAELRKINEERDRTVRIRMEAEEAAGLRIDAAGNCAQLSAGHRFTLERHAEAAGTYLLTGVTHEAQNAGYQGGDAPAYYRNRFTCLPDSLPYRPPVVTARPRIDGVQTATVVGPAGEEVFVDKYGRVKVQFPWDRQGKKDSASSCWVRVAQAWAGKGWGTFFWPRIGHEVVVTFEDGDPDHPLIVGSVYNAANMPPFTLPLCKAYGVIRSATVRGNARRDFNGIIFNDTRDHEHLSIHSEHSMSFNSEHDKMFHAGRHKGERVAGAALLTVGNLPGGGGSGGGFESGFDVDSNTIQHPKPTEVPGLNSIFVYGENLQVAVGLNHQLAVGSNLQICVNPAGLMDLNPIVPQTPMLEAYLGSGMGGNMQLTIGTSYNVIIGQSVTINAGPIAAKTIDFTGYKKNQFTLYSGTTIACYVLGGVVLAWVLAYGLDSDEHARAMFSLAFQLAIDACLIAIVAITEMIDAGHGTFCDIMGALFKYDATNQKLIDGNEPYPVKDFDLGLIASLVATVLMPSLAIGDESSAPETVPGSAV